MNHNPPNPTPDLPQTAGSLLARNGLGGITPEPFASDASHRRYFRLAGTGRLLMDDRQDPQGFAGYLQLSRHLNTLGLSAPRVYDADTAEGLALIEDFGDDTYGACLARGTDEAQLYRLAVSALLHLHHDGRATNVELSTYDVKAHLDELKIFTEWFLPALSPDTDRARFEAGFLDLWRAALAPAATRFDTLVLRDFHVDNLMLLKNRSGVARCGLLDFQDGVLGPCEYDLVSLLQDARRDLSPGLEDDLLAFYIGSAPRRLGGPAAIRRRFHVLGAQRHARILGVFVRLYLRDGKPRYLGFIPRVARQLQTALQEAGLTDIAGFLEAEMPGWTSRAQRLEDDLLQKGRAGG